MESSPPLFLRNLWYYALPTQQLKPGRLVAKTLLNEPILFGRQRTGEAFALRDVCPHRAVPLSCGQFDGKAVECCYHGWRFDATGRCMAIPSLTDGQKVNLERFQVEAYPVQEQQGNIWIYMRDRARPPKAEPSIEMAAPTVPGFVGKSHQGMAAMSFPCYVDHAVVGLMDPAHVPFVHRSWWWRDVPELSEEVKAFDPSPYGFTMREHPLVNQTLFYRLVGKSPTVEISFQLPGVRIERVTTAQHQVCNLTTITPISESETEVTTLFYSTIPWFPALMPLLQPFVRNFLNQDRDMVVKQQIGLRTQPKLLLIRDADTQARWYYRLKREFAQSVAASRPFVNPISEQTLRWRS